LLVGLVLLIGVSAVIFVLISGARNGSIGLFGWGACCTFVINRAVVEGWEVIACNMPPAKALEH